MVLRSALLTVCSLVFCGLLPAQELPSPEASSTAPPSPVSVLRLLVQEAESAPATPVATTTDDGALEALRGEVHHRCLELARQVLERMEACPAPTEHAAFLQAREALATRSERIARLIEVAGEAKALAAEGELSAEVALREQERDFLVRLAAAVDGEGRRLDELWKESLPDEKRRQAIEAEVLRARSDRLDSEQKAARSRSVEQEATLARKRKESEDLAARAKEELERAGTEDEQRLAELRLDYARLDARAEEAKTLALRVETEARGARAALERSRSDLAARMPVLARLAPTVPRRSEAIAELRSQAEALTKRSQVLGREIEMAEEAIPGLRATAQERLQAYDTLEEGLDAHGTSKIYRQQVYFARLLRRRAAALLDETRTAIEWKRRLRALLDEHGALLLRSAEDLRPKAVVLYLGQTLAAWKAFAFALAMTLLATWLLYPILRGLFHRIAVATHWDWDDIVLEEAAAPLRGLIFLVGGWASLNHLALSPGLHRAALVAKGVLSSLLAGFVAWRVVTAVVRILTPRIRETETTLDDQLLNFLSRTLRAVILFVAGLYVLQAFGWKIANVLAGLGIGGLAFALAAKDTLANLFGSIVLFMDRPFTVGNWVIICGAEGIVEDIGIRSTRIRTFKDTVVTIPNASVANAVAENIHSFRKRRLYFTLELRLDTPPSLVEATVERIRKILTDHPMVLDGFYVYVTGIKESGVEIMVYSFVGTRDWGEWMHHAQEVYLSVLEALGELGVGLAYPTRTVELERPAMPVYLDAVDAPSASAAS